NREHATVRGAAQPVVSHDSRVAEADIAGLEAEFLGVRPSPHRNEQMAAGDTAPVLKHKGRACLDAANRDALKYFHTVRQHRGATAGGDDEASRAQSVRAVV